jgi:hypothetical protein
MVLLFSHNNNNNNNNNNNTMRKRMPCSFSFHHNAKQQQQQQQQQQQLEQGQDIKHMVPSSSSVLQKVMTFLSEASGEKEISHLKQQVNDISQEFDGVTQQVSTIREQTVALQSKYEDLQKEHLQLMMRRESWSEVDIQRFADITSSEVHTKRELDHSRIQLKQCEDLQERTKKEYMDAVRKRYHEEQLWQDKWRVISTYGTWILIGINSIVFIGGQMLHQRREGERIRILSSLIDDKLNRIMIAADVHDVLKQQGENDREMEDATITTHSNSNSNNNLKHHKADMKRNALVERGHSTVHDIPLESNDGHMEPPHEENLVDDTHDEQQQQQQQSSTNIDNHMDTMQQTATTKSVTHPHQSGIHDNSNVIRKTIEYFKHFLVRDSRMIVSSSKEQQESMMMKSISPSSSTHSDSLDDDSCMSHGTKYYTIMNYSWIRNRTIQMKSFVHDTIQHLHTPSMVLGAVTAVAMMTLRSNSTSSGR